MVLSTYVASDQVDHVPAAVLASNIKLTSYFDRHYSPRRLQRRLKEAPLGHTVLGPLLMSPSSTFNLGTTDPDTPLEFEDTQYLNHHWQPVNPEEELPLHYMSEEKARRRIKASTGSILGEQEKEHYGDYYDDQGKDVYNKIRPKSSRSSGRPPPPLLPPPTSIVSSSVFLTETTRILNNPFS